jgi:type I site-specific restriction endonuclease
LHNINEAKTRQLLIDPAIQRAGWNLRDHQHVRFEIPVDGYDAAHWNGTTNYCFHRPNGEVIAVVEAKRTSRELRLAEQQAELLFQSLLNRAFQGNCEEGS